MIEEYRQRKQYEKVTAYNMFRGMLINRGMTCLVESETPEFGRGDTGEVENREIKVQMKTGHLPNPPSSK